MVAHIVTQSADLSGRDSRRSACARRTLRPLPAPWPESPKLTGPVKHSPEPVDRCDKKPAAAIVCGPKTQRRLNGANLRVSILESGEATGVDARHAPVPECVSRTNARLAAHCRFDSLAKYRAEPHHSASPNLRKSRGLPSGGHAMSPVAASGPARWRPQELPGIRVLGFDRSPPF